MESTELTTMHAALYQMAQLLTTETELCPHSYLAPNYKHNFGIENKVLFELCPICHKDNSGVCQKDFARCWYEYIIELVKQGGSLV